jgi:hypothetical protein
MDNLPSVAEQTNMPDDQPAEPGIPAIAFEAKVFALLVSGFGTMNLCISIYILTTHAKSPQMPRSDDAPVAILGFIIATLFFVATGFFVRYMWRTAKRRRERLAQLRADALPERAKHAAQVLQEATGLVTELQAELAARTVLLEDVQRQVAEANRRVGDMEKLSRVDSETTTVLNKYFDEALTSRLETLERSARRREWLLGTVGALLFGITAILLSHYLFGF